MGAGGYAGLGAGVYAGLGGPRPAMRFEGPGGFLTKLGALPPPQVCHVLHCWALHPRPARPSRAASQSPPAACHAHQTVRSAPATRHQSMALTQTATIGWVSGIARAFRRHQHATEGIGSPLGDRRGSGIIAGRKLGRRGIGLAWPCPAANPPAPAQAPLRTKMLHASR